jgi:2-haloacid dehalogenase
MQSFRVGLRGTWQKSCFDTALFTVLAGVLMARVIVFDVNETLLDLRGLDPHFARVFGAADVREEWFSQVVRSALVATVTNVYSDFSTIGGAALEMTAKRHEISLTTDDRADILGAIRKLAPHADVRESLTRLRDAGLRLAAFTNSTAKVVETQLENVDLHRYFEQILSADWVHRLKPAPEAYRMAAQRLGVTTADLRMVAAHDWDIIGALRAGCAAAFVARPGMVLDPLAEQPDIVGADLRMVAHHILEAER